MNFVTKKAMPRRTFLRGVMGATVALPLLDSMVPALSAGVTPKSRFGFIYVPHGAVMKQWTPAVEGAGFELTPTLSPLAPFKDKLLVVSGLANTAAEAQGDGGGEHPRSAPAFLTGAHPLKTTNNDVRVGASLDQVIAKQLGQDTPIPSLELGMEDTGIAGICDGYNCAYFNSISWRTPTEPLPMEINPRVVFERLFGDGRSATERLAQKKVDNSILDSINSEVKTLQKGLGPADRAKVSQYLDGVREIERRIQKAEKQSENSEFKVPDTPVGVPDSWDDHIRIMLDLQVLAWQAEITRVSSMMFARDLSGQTFPQIGIKESFHPLSHHGDSPDKLERLAKVNQYHISLLAYFLDKLRNISDGDGSLLDHSTILYGSSMSNSNVHDHAPVPLVVVGGGSGQLKGGRHLRFPDRTPTANLLLSLLNKAGVEQGKFGESTGTLSGV